jgi:hypothetical protein
MTDSAGTVYSNTAHQYAECSNKGLCDRTLGECMCLPGYEGAACQRASCPSQLASSNIAYSVFNMQSPFGNQFSSFSTSYVPSAESVFIGNSPSSSLKPDCSGHGVCQTISSMASSNGDDTYKLWDKDSSMGCVCDPG